MNCLGMVCCYPLRLTYTKNILYPLSLGEEKPPNHVNANEAGNHETELVSLQGRGLGVFWGACDFLPLLLDTILQ